MPTNTKSALKPKMVTHKRLLELVAEANDPVAFVAASSCMDLRLALEELGRLRHAHRVMRKALLGCANVLFSLEKGSDLIRIPKPVSKLVWKTIHDRIEDAKKVLDV